MKNVLIVLGFLLIGISSNAQLKTPQPSPAATIKQVVGLTDISLEYSRPSKKGREIFGNLVPFDAVWRTGANKNTIITFSDAVKIEGKEVAKGSYAIFTKPGKQTWEIYFYKDTENWGTPKDWDASKVAAQVKVTPQNMENIKVETFMLYFGELTNNSTVLELLWDTTYVPIKIEVPTKEKATKNIETALNGPTGNDFYSAASYHLAEGKELDKALTWITKAVEMRGEDAFWMLRKKSLIEAKLGKTKEAIASAKRSLASAEKAGNTDYVKMNKDSLKEWGN